MIDVVLEALTVRDWFGAVRPWICRQERGAVRRLRAVDASPIAFRLAQWWGRDAGVEVAPLAFRLVDLRDGSGLSLRHRILYQDLVEIHAAAMRDPLLQGVAQPGARLQSFLAKSVSAPSWLDDGTLWRALLIVQICAGRDIVGAARPVLFLRQRAWAKLVVAYAARHGVEAYVLPTGGPVPPRVAARRALTPRQRALLRYVAHAPWRARPEPPPATPVIAADYFEHLNLGHPERQSDLFFWPRPSLTGADLLLLLRRALRQTDAEAIAANGIAAVAIERGSAGQGVPRFACPPPRRTPRDARHGQTRLERYDARWVARRREEYEVVRHYWQRLFTRHNVGVYVTWYRYDASHCAIADAIEDTGGISVVYQRSYEPDASVESLVDADVMLGFAPADARREQESGSRIRYHVAVGFLGDHRFPLLRECGRPVRARLHAAGARTVVAYFDENSHDDARWQAGHDFHRANYAFLLTKVLDEPSIGLIVKPKMASTLRRRLGPVAELLARAEATGRCVVFESGPGRSADPPAAAALAADIAIHGHLCAGTAAVEAALAGVPTLLLDREGWAVSPLYRLGVGRVVFTDWPSLWEACHDVSAGHAPPGLGDWSPLLEELDPFRDGRAAGRMGDYLGTLLDGLRAGVGRDAAMAQAAERYAERWGKDKVTEVNAA